MFCQISQIKRSGHAIETEFFLDDELPVIIERQVDRTGNDGGSGDQHDLSGHGIAGDGENVAGQILESAAECEPGQNDRVDDKCCQAETDFCKGIVSRLAVRVGSDAASELFRYLVAMFADIAPLSRSEPETGKQGRKQKKKK